MLIRFIAIILCVPAVFCGDHYKIQLKNIVCTHNETLISNSSCFITNDNRGNQFITINFAIAPNVELNNLMGKITILQKTHDSFKYKVFIGINNITLDVCSLASEKTKHIILDMVIDELKRHGNVMQPCPWKEQIYVRGMLLDVKKLLTVINFADYIFQLYTYLPTKRNAEMFISNIKVYGEVKSV